MNREIYKYSHIRFWIKIIETYQQSLILSRYKIQKRKKNYLFRIHILFLHFRMMIKNYLYYMGNIITFARLFKWIMYEGVLVAIFKKQILYHNSAAINVRKKNVTNLSENVRFSINNLIVMAKRNCYYLPIALTKCLKTWNKIMC